MMIEQTTRNRIGSYYRAGKSDAGWYRHTAEALEGIFEDDTRLFLGLLAATSPNTTVRSNVTIALREYRAIIDGGPRPNLMPAVRANVERFLETGTLRGPKVSAFFEALAGNRDAVVIDRWILRAYGFPSATPKRIDFITADIRRRAKQARVSARAYQAAVWFGIKAEAETGKVNRDNRPFEAHIREIVS